MITCDRCRALLSLYHDAVLVGNRGSEGDAVRAHLADCPDCAAILAAYRRDEARITAALISTPNPRLRAAVLAATVHRGTGESRPVRERPLRRRGQILIGGLGGAGMAVLAILLVALAGNLSRSGHQTPQLASSTQGRATALAWVAGAQVGSDPLLGGQNGVPNAHPTAAPPAPAPLGQAPPLAPAIGPLVTARDTAPAPVDHAASLRMSPETILAAGAIRLPLWSPDSASLLYLSHWAVDPATGWYAGALMRYNSAGIIQLATEVRDFDWSPDGHSVVYTTENAAPSGDPRVGLEAARLHVVRADGTSDRLLSGVDHANVEWFPAGIVAVQSGVLVQIDPSTGRAFPLAGIPSVAIAAEPSGFFALSANERFLPTRMGAASGSGIGPRAAPSSCRGSMSAFPRLGFISHGRGIRFFIAPSTARPPSSIGRGWRPWAYRCNSTMA